MSDIDEPTNSNIRAAMDKVAKNLDVSVSPLVKNDDGPADKQILIRTTDYERDRWKDASSKEQLTVSAWIRKTLNAEATNILECSHPVEFVKYYPWSRTCTKCGQRLK